MTRKRTRRHARQAEASPLLSRMVFTAAADADQPMPQHKREKQLAPMWSALEAIARGQHPGEDEWRDVSDAVNLIEPLWLRGHLVRDEVAGVWEEACHALARAGARWHERQVMRMDAAGLTAVRGCVQLYQQALEGLPERDILLAIYETRDRLRAIKSGRMPTDRQVVIL